MKVVAFLVNYRTFFDGFYSFIWLYKTGKIDDTATYKTFAENITLHLFALR